MIVADVLLNCSGHKLTPRAEEELLRQFGHIEDVPIPTLSFDEDIERQIREIVSQIATPLDGSATVSVVPPGQSTVAILLLAYLNGIIGYFPSICYLAADRPGEYMPRAVFVLDPQGVRDGGRRFRQSQWYREPAAEGRRKVPTG